jgi:hypothetical protein
VAGVKRLMRLPSGSRNKMERFPQGISVGSCTHSLTRGFSRSYSASTSSTANSMMAVWFCAGWAALLNSSAVLVWARARVDDGYRNSAKTGASQSAEIPVTLSFVSGTYATLP